MAEIRESIRDTIDDIPVYVSKAKQYIEVFADTPELHKCNADLYVAIIDALDAILQQCQQHIARKSCDTTPFDIVSDEWLILLKGRLSSAIFRQKMSGRELQNKIKDIGIYSERLVTQANISSMRRQKVMLEDTEDLTKMIISSARGQDRGFSTMATSHIRMLRSLQFIESQLCVLNQCHEFLKASPKPAPGFAPTVGYLGPNPAIERHSNMLEPSSAPSKAIEQHVYRQQLQDLLSKLSDDQQPNIAAIDASEQLGLIHTLSLASQDRAVALLMSSRLRTWLVSSSSSMLHINGCMFSQEHEARQSPLSYFCAKFIDSVLARNHDLEEEPNNPVIAVC